MSDACTNITDMKNGGFNYKTNTKFFFFVFSLHFICLIKGVKCEYAFESHRCSDAWSSLLYSYVICAHLSICGSPSIQLGTTATVQLNTHFCLTVFVGTCH